MLEERLRIEDRGRELLVDAEAVEGRRRADLAVLDGRRLDPAEEPEPGKGLERGGELRRGDGPERRPGRVPSMGPEKVFFHEPRPPLRKLLPDFRMERVANHESPELRMTGKNQEDSSSHCGVFLIFMATAAEEERAPSGGMGSWLPAIEETSEASSANRRLPYSLSRGVHFENSIV